MQVGFIGLGRMGSPIAANLLAAGHDLTVYNRTKAKAEHLVKRGAQLAKTPGDAARGDVVITMLADDHASRPLCLGTRMPRHLPTSSWCRAGKRETVAKCQPLFDEIGQRTFPIGEEPQWRTWSSSAAIS